MVDTTLTNPTTISQALTTSYLANDYLVQNVKRLELWLDDVGIGYTVKFQVGNLTWPTGGYGDWIELIVDAGAIYTIDPPSDASVRFNVKSASGAPNLQILAL